MNTTNDINEKLDLLRSAIGSAQSPDARRDMFRQYRDLLREKAALLNDQQQPMQQRVEEARSATADISQPVYRPSVAYRVMRWISGL